MMMKKLKNYLLIGIFSIISFALVLFPNMSKINRKTYAEPLNDEVFDYISISTNGQKLTKDNLKTYNDNTYIISNGSITVNFNVGSKFCWFETTLSNPADFYKSYETISIEKSTEITDLSKQFFTLNNVSYFYEIIEDETKIHIYKNKTEVPSVSDVITLIADYTNCNEWIQVSYDEATLAESNTLTIKIAKSITLDAEAPNSTLTFTPHQTDNEPLTTSYTLNFERPIADFSQTSVISFEYKGVDVSNDGVVSEKLKKELSYSNLKLIFTNNDYTPLNPLYFDINHNGFVYNFKLYYENINSFDCLFVDYYNSNEDVNSGESIIKGRINDLEHKPDASLATVYNKADNIISTKILKTDNSQTNKFTLNFTETGRYEVIIYDSTYVLNLKNNNYYKTSFYIKDSTTVNPFDNVYFVTETLTDDGVHLDYIVSKSTLNYDVQLTLKNLDYYFEKAVDILQEIEDDPENPILVVRKTTFTGSTNRPEETVYTKKQLADSLNSAGDFVLRFNEDAYYQFKIYNYTKQDDTLFKTIRNPDLTSTTKYITDPTDKFYSDYQFTIVKEPKTVYSWSKIDPNTCEEVDEDEDGNIDIETHYADIPYKTDVQNYSRKIKSNLTLKVLFDSTTSENEKGLVKKYDNKYNISYAMQQVSMEEFDMKGSNNEVLNQLNIRFSGIGDITVTVTVNGKTTTHTLNSEQGNDTLSFTEYGIYTVTIVDSMGTTTTEIFDFSEPANMSTLLLIGLVGVLLVGLAIFIVVSRSKIKTR